MNDHSVNQLENILLNGCPLKISPCTQIDPNCGLGNLQRYMCYHMLPKIVAELLNLSNHQEDLIESVWRGVDLFRSEDLKTFQVNKNLEMATTTKLRQWSVFCIVRLFQVCRETNFARSGRSNCMLVKRRGTWRQKLYLFPAN